MTPELKKQLSEGLHQFLNTKPPAGVCLHVFSEPVPRIILFDYVVKYEPVEGTCSLYIAHLFYLDIFQ